MSRSLRGLVIAVSAALCASCDAATLHVGPSEPFAHPPARPSEATEGPDARELFMALGDPVLVQSTPTWRHIGFDLDGIDTTSGNGTQECTPLGETPPLDGDGGTDNVFGGEISTTLEFVFPGLADSIVDAMVEGRGTLLVRVTAWNGREDDPQVQVELLQSVDGTTEAAGDVSFDGVELVRVADGMPALAPAWAGADRWYARGSATGGSPTVHTDSGGYVAGGVLVFRIAEPLEVRYFYGSVEGTFRLREALFTVALDDTLAACGTTMIGGRASVDDLVVIAEYVGYCEGTPEREELDMALRVNADLLVDPAMGPSATCDAISVGVRFDRCAFGEWIDTIDLPPPPDLCP